MSENQLHSSESSEEWERAQERVLLYLKLFPLPPSERLTLTLDILNRAKCSQRGSPPLPAAIQAARELLVERLAKKSSPLRTIPFPLEERWPGLQGTPPLNRGFIKLSEFDRTTFVTVVSFLLGCVIKGVGIPVRMLLRPFFLFFMLSILVSLFWTSNLN